MQQHINEIKTLVSCPPKIYSQLYLSTLSQFVIHCPADLLKQRLKLAIAVLKLRQGILLPKNAGAEAIAAEEAQWTYALLSGCLLQKLGIEFIERVVPTIAQCWLQKNNLLFAQWQDIILDKPNDKNELEYVIKKAIDKLALSPTKE